MEILSERNHDNRFIKKVVTAYFFNQTYYDLEGRWIWGERKHGLDGIIEYYQEELKIKDISFIYRFIENLTKVNVNKNQECFCKSKQRLKYCHLNLLQKYRNRINPEIAEKSLNIFNSELEKYMKFCELEKLRADQNKLRKVILGIK